MDCIAKNDKYAETFWSCIMMLYFVSGCIFRTILLFSGISCIYIANYTVNAKWKCWLWFSDRGRFSSRVSGEACWCLMCHSRARPCEMDETFIKSFMFCWNAIDLSLVLWASCRAATINIFFPLIELLKNDRLSHYDQLGMQIKFVFSGWWTIINPNELLSIWMQ